MTRHNVSSSHVAAVGWEAGEDDATVGTLEVEFNDGSVYQYNEVPQGEYDLLRQASSVGSYLLRNIKGNYEYSRVQGSAKSITPNTAKFIRKQKQWE